MIATKEAFEPHSREQLPNSRKVYLPGVLHPDRWLLWLGLLFIASVYFFPTGVVGRLRSGVRRARQVKA